MNKKIEPVSSADVDKFFRDFFKPERERMQGILTEKEMGTLEIFSKLAFTAGLLKCTEVFLERVGILQEILGENNGKVEAE